MCLVQPSRLYNFYFHVYAFIILTLTRTYIRTTTCGNHQFLVMQVEKKSSQVCSYQISLVEHDIHSLLYRNTAACNVNVGDRITEG